jgi:hypothetical protein
MRKVMCEEARTEEMNMMRFSSDFLMREEGAGDAQRCDGAKRHFVREVVEVPK